MNFCDCFNEIIFKKLFFVSFLSLVDFSVVHLFSFDVRKKYTQDLFLLPPSDCFDFSRLLFLEQESKLIEAKHLLSISQEKAYKLQKIFVS